MNRNDLLLTSSLITLLCAGGAALWLLWDSWEDKQMLIRRNRELQASLEASRIRLENYCEYPAGALCDVNIPQGSLASLMETKRPEPADDPASPHGSPAASGIHDTIPQLTEKPVFPSSPTAADEPANSLQGSHAEKTSHPSNDISADSASDFQLWLEASHEELPSGSTKKTWSRITQTSDQFSFFIAGEGDSLRAEGTMLEDPSRYVVALEGLWRLRVPAVENNCIERLQKTFTDDRTLLTFFLKKTPASTSVKQVDPRTIAITIH